MIALASSISVSSSKLSKYPSIEVVSSSSGLNAYTQIALSMIMKAVMTDRIDFFKLSHSSIEKKIIADAIGRNLSIHKSDAPGRSWMTAYAVLVVDKTMIIAVINPARALFLLATAPKTATRKEMIPK